MDSKLTQHNISSCFPLIQRHKFYPKLCAISILKFKLDWLLFQNKLTDFSVRWLIWNRSFPNFHNILRPSICHIVREVEHRGDFLFARDIFGFATSKQYIIHSENEIEGTIRAEVKDSHGSKPCTY